MDLIQKTALSLVSLTRDERKAIPAGDYSVDALVRIRSTFGKGTDTDKVPTCRVLTLDTLALLFKRMGITRDAAQALLLEVFTEVIHLDKDAKAILQAEFGLLEAKKTFSETVLSKLPKTPVTGAVRGTSVVEVVGLIEETNLETGEVRKIVTSA